MEFKLRKLPDFVNKLYREQMESVARRFPDLTFKEKECAVTTSQGKRWIRVDVGTSGKYLVEISTGDIYGIKAYGVPDLKRKYGNLETIDDYYWGDYSAILLKK